MSETPGYVTITSTNPNLRVLARLADGRPTLTGGVAIYEEIARPKLTSITEFAGSTPYRMQLGVILDGLADGRDQEPFARNLRRMISYDEIPQPPRITVAGVGVPGTEYTWVIEDLVWDSNAIISDTGALLRQPVQLTLLQFVTDQRLRLLAAANQARQRTSSTAKPKKIYVVKSGDTLQEIAKKQLGSAAKWKDIAKLNNIRDARNIKVGQKLRIP